MKSCASCARNLADMAREYSVRVPHVRTTMRAVFAETCDGEIPGELLRDIHVISCNCDMSAAVIGVLCIIIGFTDVRSVERNKGKQYFHHGRESFRRSK